MGSLKVAGQFTSHNCYQRCTTPENIIQIIYLIFSLKVPGTFEELEPGVPGTLFRGIWFMSSQQFQIDYQIDILYILTTNNE